MMASIGKDVATAEERAGSREKFYAVDHGKVLSLHDNGQGEWVVDDAPIPADVRKRLKGAPTGDYDANGKGLHGTRDVAGAKTPAAKPSRGDFGDNKDHNPTGAVGPATSSTSATTPAPNVPVKSSGKKSIPQSLLEAIKAGPTGSGKPLKQGSGTGSIRGTTGIPIGIPYTKNADGTYTPNYVPPGFADGQPISSVPSGLTGRASFETSQVTGALPQGGQAYVSGDELRPVKHPEQVPHLQQQMVAAGLLDPKQVTPGLWTDQEANAMVVVLGQANRQGLTAEKMLDWMATNHKLPPIHVDPVADIDALAREVIQPLLGQDLTPDQFSKFESAYQKWQYNQLTQAQDQAQSITPNQVQIDPQKPSTFAHDWATQNLGGEVGGNTVVDNYQRLVGSLGPSVSTGV